MELSIHDYWFSFTMEISSGNGLIIRAHWKSLGLHPPASGDVIRVVRKEDDHYAEHTVRHRIANFIELKIKENLKHTYCFRNTWWLFGKTPRVFACACVLCLCIVWITNLVWVVKTLVQRVRREGSASHGCQRQRRMLIAAQRRYYWYWY